MSQILYHIAMFQQTTDTKPYLTIQHDSSHQNFFFECDQIQLLSFLNHIVATDKSIKKKPDERVRPLKYKMIFQKKKNYIIEHFIKPNKDERNEKKKVFMNFG